MEVLAVAILSLFAAFAYQLRVTYYAQNLAQASALNRRLIELVRSNGTALSNPDPVALDAPPFETQTFSAEELQRFRRTVVVERVDSDPSKYQYSLWRIRVGVHWRDKGSPFQLYYESIYREP